MTYIDDMGVEIGPESPTPTGGGSVRAGVIIILVIGVSLAIQIFWNAKILVEAGKPWWWAFLID